MSKLKEHLIIWPTLIILGTALVTLLYFINTRLGDAKPMYNCSIAEISPDFTPAMKEECRKIKLTYQRRL
jgi:hypothetical protein